MIGWVAYMAQLGNIGECLVQCLIHQFSRWVDVVMSQPKDLSPYEIGQIASVACHDSWQFNEFVTGPV